ncbi:hypothetical protein Thimo_2896 [Thioflavicoccus mobilis 8321]|uniref:Uncharacterized protein n=1 Tax=Thioflavicoccus mobilis 8321 TaxID=765912 RepID=L0GXW2_9GAMM|nr:magnetosome protein MamC [Thioflavicoccus mobilis]AGA91593.1 hypothetical protein Thimo_2896 [Thioflavicoccus mobilis 8321]
MSDRYDTLLYPSAGAPPYPPDTLCSSLTRLAALGALVAGSAAAATNLNRAQAQEIEPGEAFAATARSAAVGAIATALGGALAGTVAEQGLLRLGLMFAVGTGTAYALDRWSYVSTEDEHE